MYKLRYKNSSVLLDHPYQVSIDDYMYVCMHITKTFHEMCKRGLILLSYIAANFKPLAA